MLFFFTFFCTFPLIGNHGPTLMLGNGHIYNLYELLLSSNVNFVKGVFADICYNGENNTWEWVTIANLLIELLTMFSCSATTKTTLIAKLWETRSMLLILQRFFENRNTFCLNQNLSLLLLLLSPNISSVGCFFVQEKPL